MTKIDYLDEIWNPITGCSGKGCAVRESCWARAIINRFPSHHWTPNNIKSYDFSTPIFHPDRLNKPLHWKKPRRIGVCFMGDWMDDQVYPSWIDRILEVIAACPQHQFFSLTKQAQNLEEKIYGFDDEVPARELGGGDYLPNLWNGVSCCTQADADRMVPDLLRVPGKKWISLEPMISNIQLKASCLSVLIGDGPERMDDISWIVLGCHNNQKKYPFKMEWAESIIEQCKAAGIPLWIKQLPVNGRCNRNPEDWPEWARVRKI